MRRNASGLVFFRGTARPRDISDSERRVLPFGSRFAIPSALSYSRNTALRSRITSFPKGKRERERGPCVSLSLAFKFIRFSGRILVPIQRYPPIKSRPEFSSSVNHRCLLILYRRSCHLSLSISNSSSRHTRDGEYIYHFSPDCVFENVAVATFIENHGETERWMIVHVYNYPRAIFAQSRALFFFFFV